MGVEHTTCRARLKGSGYVSILPVDQGVKLLNLIQDVYLDAAITIA